MMFRKSLHWQNSQTTQILLKQEINTSRAPQNMLQTPQQHIFNSQLKSETKYVRKTRKHVETHQNKHVYLRRYKVTRRARTRVRSRTSKTRA